MNVGLLIDSLESGGAERTVQQLALGLTQCGHRVCVYCLKTAGPGAEVLRVQRVVVREACSTGRDARLIGRLLRWLRADRIDVANAQSSAAAVGALLPARLLGIPLIQTRQGNLLGPPSRYRRLADRAVNLFDRVVIVSESLRTTLPPGRAARRAVFIPNGVDREPVSPTVARAALEALCGGTLAGPVILSVGTICREKDTCGLLRAFARLRTESPTARLVCVGGARDTGYLAAVRRDERELGLPESVHWLGEVNDAYRLMAGADVFCQASVTEATPVAVVEAMSQGVPIVATAVGGVGQLPTGTGGTRPFTGGTRPFTGGTPMLPLLRHNETGLLVPPSDPETLAETLRYALSDRAASGRRAERARLEYERFFSGRCMVARYERLFAQCARRHAAPRATRTGPLKLARRPRILMLGPAAPQTGGMVNAIQLLLNGPLRERYELRLFPTAFTPDTSSGDPRDALATGSADVVAALGRHLRALRRLARTLIRERFDLVHIHTCSYFSFYRNLLDLAVAKALGRGSVLHIHGGQFEQFGANAGQFGRWIVRRGGQLADAVIVLSPQWRSRLAPYFGRARIAVVPNGVSIPVELRSEFAGCPTTAASRAADRLCRFLFLGPLTEAKGLGDLIEAVALLRNAGVRFMLDIVGPAPAPQRARWEQRLRTAGLNGVARLSEPVAATDVHRLLTQVDCLVHPSHSEGLPLTVLEAAAAGLPVIAAAVGSVPELMAGVGICVPAHDPPALASAMARLVGDGELRQRIGHALRAHVAAHYAIERQVERLTLVYDSILKQRGHKMRPPGRGTTKPGTWAGPARREQSGSRARLETVHVVVASG